MSKLTINDIYNCLENNEDNMVIYARLPEAIREGIRDLWDALVSTETFSKFGFDGWRPCRDQGPQKHVVYALRANKMKVGSAPIIKLDEEDPKDVYINGKGILSAIKDLNKRVTELESNVDVLIKAVSSLIRTSACSKFIADEEFYKILDDVRKGIVIHN